MLMLLVLGPHFENHYLSNVDSAAVILNHYMEVIFEVTKDHQL